MESAASVQIDIGGNLAPFEAALAKARQMADLFDQQVSKKLGNTGASEAGLQKIASLIEQTNALLGKMTGTVNTTDASMNKFTGDAEKAAGAVDDVKSSAAAAAPAVGKLSSEANTAAASIQRATLANQQFTASNRALAAASNLKLADGTAASTEEMQAYAVALDDIRAKYNPLFKVTRDYLTLKDELRIATKLGALSESEAAAALSTNRRETLAAIAVIKGHTDALNDHGNAAGLDATRMAALLHAVRSFSEQIALGVSPLQALTGQFNHLSYVASGAGGVSGALSSIGNMALGLVTKFARVGAAIGGAAIGFEYLRNQAAETEKRTVGFGETAVAIFQVVRDGIRNAFGPYLAVVFDPLIYAFKKLGSAAVDIGELVINSFHAAFVDVKTIWAALPDSFALTFTAAANFGIDTLNLLIKKSSDAVDQIITIFNRLGADIPLLNAGKETIPPIDDKPYIDSLDKLVSDRNARIKEIMSSTPIRDFGQAVIDRIQTNHALEGLDALANVDFGKSIGGAGQLGNAIGGIGSNAAGVTVTIGGMAQQVINVTKAFEDAKRAQLGQLVSAQQNLVQMKQQAVEVQQFLDAAGKQSVSNVFGSFVSDTAQMRQAIADAASGIAHAFDEFDAHRETAVQVNAEIEKIRQTLLALGGDPNVINPWVNKLINSQLQVRQLNSDVQTLGHSIATLPNRTVTITVVTRKVGSGTQSLYDVPNGSGTSSVGVTRYGSDGSAGASMSAYSVPSEGGSYGSQGGSGGSGSSTVNVTRYSSTGPWENPNGATANEWSQLTAQNKQDIYEGKTDYAHILYPDYYRAGGGPISARTPYWVGEQGPELVVPSSGGTVIPNAQSVALAQQLGNAQSGFTGRQATSDQDRIWTVLMNVEANTRKTAQILDDIKTASAATSSALNSSYSGSSSVDTSQQDQLTQQYLQVLKQVKANFSAAGIIGRGIIGYGLDGLAASPEEIARNIVYGGSKTVAGFATGGMIAPGDSQEVRFFKSPEETVAIFTPAQVQALQGANQNQSTQAAADQRPVQFTQHNNWNGNTPPSQESLAAVRRATALGFMDAQRAARGR